MINRKTTTQTKNELEQDYVSATGAPLLRSSWLYPVLWMLAKAFGYHYDYIDDAARESCPATAVNSVPNWAGVVGLSAKPPSLGTATLSVTVTGNSSLQGGTQFTSTSGQVYSTLASLGGTPGTYSVVVQAATAGTAANLSAGSQLSLAYPISGVQTTATLLNAIAAYDAETQTELKQRMLNRFKQLPQAGNTNDYINWALQVPGVSNAWAQAITPSPNATTVFFLMNGGLPNGTDGVSQYEQRAVAASGDQLAVANYIYPLRPTCAMVYANAPTLLQLSPVITNLAPNTPQVQAAIQTQFNNMITTNAAATGYTLNISMINAAIEAGGATTYNLIYPTSPVITTTPYLLTPGTISFN